MEDLFAEFLLWFHGFNKNGKYEELLNEYFLNSTNCKIFLELEECSSNVLDTSGCFERYWNFEGHIMDADKFGKRLFDGLGTVYKANKFPIEDFGKKCYSLWHSLPFQISKIEPFWTLSYADDCLSWNNEAETRRLYEEAFAFYRD